MTSARVCERSYDTPVIPCHYRPPDRRPVASIPRDGTGQPVRLPTPLDGEYGLEAVSLSVSMTLLEHGIGGVSG